MRATQKGEFTDLVVETRKHWILLQLVVRVVVYHEELLLEQCDDDRGAKSERHEI